jgi:chromosome segregation ATPase
MYSLKEKRLLYKGWLVFGLMTGLLGSVSVIAKAAVSNPKKNDVSGNLAESNECDIKVTKDKKPAHKKNKKSRVLKSSKASSANCSVGNACRKNNNDMVKCLEFQKEHLYNGSIIKQNQSKLVSLEERKKLVEPAIDASEKELKGLSLCRDRKRKICELKADNKLKIEGEIESLNKQISAKMDERLSLTTESQNLNRSISGKSLEISELKSELKLLNNSSFQLRKEVKRLEKVNEKIRSDIRCLEVEMKEADIPYTPLDMF